MPKHTNQPGRIQIVLGVHLFNVPTQKLIIDNSFMNIGSPATVSDADVTELIKHIGRWKEHIAAVVGVKYQSLVTLPFILVIKLYAM